jgi:uncharacterized protein YciI
MRFFMLAYKRGPNWREGEPLQRQPLQGHLRFLAALHRDGKLVMAGPYRDAGGGIAIVQMHSPEEAQEVAASDPGVQASVLRVEVQEWQPIDWGVFADAGVRLASERATVVFQSPSSA